ncbi:MAG: GNAT family N-acetyltransferase [Acidobacteriota bacterium]|nr:GNAT family N-acetyltransferase [Acidobacteriota bacterium]
MELKSERLTLKPVGAADSDLEILERVVTDEFVRRYLFDDRILDRNEIAGLIDASRESFRAKNYGLWLIILDKSGETIGFTGLWHFFDEAQPQLLYALLPEFTGAGFAAEAARKIIEYAFFKLSFAYLDASCDAPNEASQKVAANLGMKIYKQEKIDGRETVFFRLENK